jgi:4-amino-4-deoxy-L-arabinose transferase-like glycosyltransferase
MRVRRSFWITLLLLAVLSLAALPTLLYPLTRDQGAYAYIADLMMRGGVPYRDALDLKPPAIYLTYMLAFSLFGRTEFAVRLFDVLFALLSAASVHFLAREVFQDRRAAALSGWLYAICYYWLIHFYSAANPEAFMVPFLAVAAVSLVRGLRSRSYWPFLLAGVASGFVFWFKPTAGLVVLGLLAWTLLEVRREHWTRRDCLRSLAAIFGGAVLGVLPIGLYLYGRGLEELLKLWRVYGTGAYVGARGLAVGGGPLAALDVLVAYVREWQLLVWLTLAGGVAISLRWHAGHAEPARWGGAVIAFLLSSVMMVLAQGKLFEYHWIPAFAPAAILSAASVVWLGDEWRNRLSTRLHPEMGSLLAVIAIAGLLLLMGYDRLAPYRRTIAYLRGRMSSEQYYAQFDIGRDFSHMGTVAAATYLQEHTQPQETAMVWGAEPLVSFLAQRRSPTRYIFSYMLANENSDAHVKALRQDLMSDLRQNPPAYVVLVENDTHPLSPSGSRAELKQFPELERWWMLEYQFEQQVEDYLFYSRR